MGRAEMSSPQSYFPSEEFAMRNIDRKIYEDTWVQSLDDRHRLTWIMLLNSFCDDQGRFELNPRTMRFVMFFGDNISDSDVKALINDFVVAKRIIQYEDGGRIYYQVTNWWKYQQKSLFMSKSKFPAPPGWEDAYRYNDKGRKLAQSANWQTREKAAGYITLHSVMANLSSVKQSSE